MTRKGIQSLPPASAASPEAARTRTVIILAITVLTLAASELFRIYISDSAHSIVSRCAYLALCIALIPHFSFREWSMAALAGLFTLGLVLRGDTDAVLLAADRAAFFAAFIYLVTLLKEAAQRSGSVLELGVYLTRQPQGRRYFSIALGGHAMGVLLNFGAVSLLTPLIQRGAKEMASTGQGTPSAEQLERQQISALLRGFSWMIMWAPTALTQAVLFTSFPSAQPGVVIPLGIAASIVMILIGRVIDRITWRHLPRANPSAAPAFPRQAVGRFALICTVLVALTFTVAAAAHVSAAVALMLVAPLIMGLWVVAQQVQIQWDGAAIRSLRSFDEIFLRSPVDPARSAFVLGTAGFIGQVAAELAPVTEFAAWLDPDAVPAWIFLAALPALITLGGQLALSPIMVVVFLSAVINELPALPADPNLIVFALGAGWALSMTASPNASATLLISAVTKIAPTTLTWRWNGTYALVCFAVFVTSFYLFSFGSL